MDRIILHCDLNNFYASVECLYNPSIRDKPVVVGGSQEQRHGIILAKNQIAKSLGIKTGEAIWQAKAKSSDLVVVKPNYSLYLKFSKLAKNIYNDYTDLIESFGIDECWLDVSGSTRLFGDGKKIAYEIKERIKTELGITASLGVSFNKIFAKLGSDFKKPDAVTVITQDNFKEIVWNLPVEELLYVGPSTKRRLNKIGIFHISQLAIMPLKIITDYLGKWGEILWYFANGYDDAPVTKVDHTNNIKSIGNSMTTPRNLMNDDDVKLLFYVLSESVGERLRRHNLRGRTVQIYIRDKDLHSIERQEKLIQTSYISGEIAKKANKIFLNSWEWKNPIRSLGVRVTDLETADTCIQLNLLDDYHKRMKMEALDLSIDAIRGRFGHYSIQRAIMLTDRKLNANPVEENVIHPISYFR